jgi:hypothetical protein
MIRVVEWAYSQTWREIALYRMLGCNWEVVEIGNVRNPCREGRLGDEQKIVLIRLQDKFDKKLGV